MVGASKILTVSYGTFSCTLEGFDEPFSTMRAIAEYFRDLAADDRYFGAEPPVPDADMLHRIAEREIQRRVEAKVQDNGVVLRAQELPSGSRPPGDQQPDERAAGSAGPMSPENAAAPQPARPAAAAMTPTAGTESVAARLQRLRMAAAQAATAGAAAGANGAARSFDGTVAQTASLRDTTHAETFEDDSENGNEMLTPTPMISDAAERDISVQTVKQVTVAPTPARAAPQPNRAGEHTEIGVETEIASDVTLEIKVETGIKSADFDAIEHEAEAADAADKAKAAEDMVEQVSLLDTDQAADTTDTDPVRETPDAPAPAVPAADTALIDAIMAAAPTTSEADGADESMIASQPAEDAAAIRDQNESRGEDDPAAEDDALTENDTRAEDAEDEALAIAASAGIADETIADAPLVEEADAPLGSDHSPRARVIKMRPDAEVEDAEVEDAEIDGAEIDELSATEIVETAAEPTAGDDDEAEDLGVGQESGEGEQEEDLDGAAALVAESRNDDTDDTDTNAGNRAETDDPTANEVDADDEPRAEAVDAAAAATASTLAPEDEAELQAELAAIEAEFADRKVAADASDTPPEVAADADPRETARANLLRQAGNQDAAMSRLMLQADNELTEPENRRRLATIAHLKAAVAATVAEKELSAKEGATRPGPSDLDRYRDDLAQVVRPRRPVSGKSGPARRPAPSERPAPLVLVSSQRVDRPAAAADSLVIRPRRVSPGNLALQERRATDALDEPEIEDDEENILADSRSFAEFAERIGARELPDVLEAAAAYAACVEGRPHFSRPQILRSAATVAQGDTSREASLRSFGMLLRQGKIQKIKRGQFAIAETSRFLPEARKISK